MFAVVAHQCPSRWISTNISLPVTLTDQAVPEIAPRRQAMFLVEPLGVISLRNAPIHAQSFTDT
jgi:hypothetical protein